MEWLLAYVVIGMAILAGTVLLGFDGKNAEKFIAFKQRAKQNGGHWRLALFLACIFFVLVWPLQTIAAWRKIHESKS